MQSFKQEPLASFGGNRSAHSLRRKRGYTKLPLNDYLDETVPLNKPPSQQQVDDSLIIGARFFLRATGFELLQGLLHIGSRKDKNFFLIRGGDRKERLMYAIKKGPRARLIDTNKKFFKNIVRQLQHPLLDPVLDLDYMTDSSLVVAIKNYSPKGSLKDLIHGSKPKDNYDFKYRQPGRPLPEPTIGMFGRQILEALLFLEASKYPYTHLHAGNVLIVDDVCILTDLELPLLKVDRHYEVLFRDFAVRNRTAFLVADLNVLAFGALLHEIATGVDLNTLRELDFYPPTASPIVRSILEKIFKGSVVPSLQELYSEPLFATAKDAVRDKPTQPITFDQQEREIVKNALKANAKLFEGETPETAVPKATTTKRGSVKLSRTGSTAAPSSMAASPSTASPRMATSPPPRAPSRPSATTPTAPRPPKARPSAPAAANDRADPPPANSGLLRSIEGFSSAKLKKTVTIDKSAPKFN